jgi:hypothetical protein
MRLKQSHLACWPAGAFPRWNGFRGLRNEVHKDVGIQKVVRIGFSNGVQGIHRHKDSRTSAWRFNSTIYAFVPFALMPTQATAQNAGDIFNWFSGIMQSVITQTTQAEWKKPPPNGLSFVTQAVVCTENFIRTD